MPRLGTVSPERATFSEGEQTAKPWARLPQPRTERCTPFAAAFEVQQRLPFHLKALRGWVREAQIGVLEIKKRGIDVDPAALRRRLRLGGPNSATMVISRTPNGAIAAIVERV